MACPGSQIIAACDFPQFLVNQTPKFDDVIMRDIRPTDSWILNYSMGHVPVGTPVEVTQDRFRSVFPNTTKKWERVVAPGVGCVDSPCDPTEHVIGWGADRLTWYAEQQTWQTPLMCYNQDMHVTHAKEHIAQIINDILRPATIAIQSNFLRKRALQWASRHFTANASLTPFTFQWSGINADEEIYLDCSVDPANVYLLAPQMLMHRFNPLMRKGYAGKNPYSSTLPYIRLVSDMDTIWTMERLAGINTVSGSIPGFPSTNWRFEEWGSANEFWKYGLSGRIGNFVVRADEMSLRFNYVTDLGAGAHGGNGNRYRYQVVLPYVNTATTGAGGAAGIGSDENPDFDAACFALTFIEHPKGMELLVPEATPLNPEMPVGIRNFAGSWQFQQHDLGADQAGVVIKNAWKNKGRFAAWFKFYVRPLRTDFMEVFFHKRERPCVPEHDVCVPCTYPAQSYGSTPPDCTEVLEAQL
jgi:hypothetical protein